MGVLNQSVTDGQIKQQVQQFVTEVFHNCGLDFENPRKEGIVTAIEQCKKSAESMMGTRGNEIIQHHYKEMMKLVEKLQ